MIHHAETQVLALLLLATAVACVTKWLRLPYTVALVAAGLLVSVARLGALEGVDVGAVALTRR